MCLYMRLYSGSMAHHALVSAVVREVHQQMAGKGQNADVIKHLQQHLEVLDVRPMTHRIELPFSDHYSGKAPVQIINGRIQYGRIQCTLRIPAICNSCQMRHLLRHPDCNIWCALRALGCWVASKHCAGAMYTLPVLPPTGISQNRLCLAYC